MEKKIEERKIDEKNQNQPEKLSKTTSTGIKPEDDKEKEIEKLKAENASLKGEVEIYKDRFLRTAAEFENFRKRTDKERIEWIQSANKQILLEVADIFEQLEMTIKSRESEKLPKNYQKCLNMVYEQFKHLLERYGLERIETIGKKFDPSFHEAVVAIDHDKYDENIICDNIKGGYKLNDKVIRPAKVAVSKGKKKNNKNNNLKEMNNE